jgi:hypothetical protein
VAVFLCSLTGTLPVGEIFSQSIAVDRPLADIDDSQDTAERVAAAWVTAADATFLGYFGTAVDWTACRAALVTNLTTGELAAAYVEAMTVSGTATSTMVFPPQVAARVSLTGGNRPNGRPIRGGFYLPTPATSMGSQFIGATQGQHIANRMQVFLDEINTAVPEITPVVWSRTLGNTTDITQLRVGNAYDTIRSRRSALVETYYEPA